MQSRVPTTDEMRRRLAQLRSGKAVTPPTPTELKRSETKPLPPSRTDVHRLPDRAKNLMMQVLKAKNFDPIEKLIDLFENSDELTDKDKAGILKDLIPYVAPRLKHTEHSGEIKGQFTVLLQDFSNPAKTIDITDLTVVDAQEN